MLSDARVLMNLVMNPDSALGPVRRAPFALVPDGSTQYVDPGGTVFSREPHSGGGLWNNTNRKFLDDGRLVPLNGSFRGPGSSLLMSGTLSGGAAGFLWSVYRLRNSGLKADGAIGSVVSTSVLGALLGLIGGVFASKIVDYSRTA